MENNGDLLGILAASWEAIGKPGKILVAFSAGADSAALLAALAELKEKLGFRLLACHVNHGLRPASEMEERQAVKYAQALGVSLEVQKVEVSREGNLEDAARRARYQALNETKIRHDADCIVLGHHAGDQAETMLMHLISGCGPEGLSGMREWSPPYWRPLLQTPKGSLIDFLRDRGLAWVEDESNADTQYTRNFLRHKVMPLLEEAHPSAQVQMARAASLLASENEAWGRMTSGWLRQNSKEEPPFHFILLAPFQSLHPAFQRRILREACGRNGISFNYEQTKALRVFALSRSIGTYNLPDRATACKSADRLHILPDAVKLTMFPWPQPGIEEAGKGYKPDRHSQVVDAEGIAGAVMRRPLPGDEIQPLGTPGSQPIRKYLSARKVDRPFRPYWPVYARGSEVLWVPGYGVSEAAAVKAGTNTKIKLVFKGKLPDEID